MRPAVVPSRKHQSLVKLVAMSPRLLVELVHRCFGLQIPDRVKLLRGPEVVRVLGTERIADGVLVARRYGRTRESMVVEVQLRVARSKRKAWALYVVGTWAELGAPTTLVVLTPSERVARWASEAIDLGHGMGVIQPLAVGPRRIPTEMSLAEARARPDALALSVLIHGHKRGSLSLGRTAIIVAQELLASEDEERMVLADLILGAVNPDVRKIVEEEMIVEGQEWFSDVVGNIMKKRAEARAEGRAEGLTEGRAEGLTEGRAEGLTEGRAEGLLSSIWMVLEARKLRPTTAQRARIARCRNPQQLTTWLHRAALARSMSEVLRPVSTRSSARARSSPARCPRATP